MCDHFALNRKTIFIVVKCVSTSANAVWDTSLDTLEQILLNNHTPQITVSMVIDQLRLWRGDDQSTTTTSSYMIQDVALAQNLIGWQAFTERCLSMDWRVHASTFLQTKTKSTLVDCYISKTAMVDSV